MTQKTLAIAFGGGGARGLAHIHVVQALEELGISPVAISGTSIGSIVGAGLACGMNAQDMRDYAIETFADSTEVLSRFWRMRPTKFGEVFNPSRLTLGNINPVKAIHAFAPAVIPENFNELAIPLQVVATDFYGQKQVVLSQGNLTEALAASAALPAIFKPVQRQGATLIDGGIVNAVPYELLFDKADIVVGIDVVGGPKKSAREVPSRIEALSGASQLMMQATTRLKRQMKPPHVFLEPPVSGIAVLDFMKARDILRDTAATVEQTKRALDDVLSNQELRTSEEV
ncbi:MAG: patatin-like phospholipase family protein [Rhizobiaceae bacterium]